MILIIEFGYAILAFALLIGLIWLIGFFYNKIDWWWYLKKLKKFNKKLKKLDDKQIEYILDNLKTKHIEYILNKQNKKVLENYLRKHKLKNINEKRF